MPQEASTRVIDLRPCRAHGPHQPCGKHPSLRTAAQNDIAALASQLEERDCKKDEVIFEHGAPARKRATAGGGERAKRRGDVGEARDADGEGREREGPVKVTDEK